jgi:hypothetical protein
MKKLTKFLVLLTFMVAFSAASYAQVSATATATAVIFTPLTIDKDVDMDFGTLASAGGGTLVLNLDNTLTASAGVTIIGGTPTAASFTVTGISGATYSMNIPGSITLTSGLNTMTVDPITNNSPGTLTGGTATIAVGGTLNVSAGQSAGTYTNTTDLTVTVNYN